MAPTSKLALPLALGLLLVAVAAGAEPHSPAPAPSHSHCPINALKLGVCANVLSMLKLKVGVPANERCCPLLAGLADLDAAVCLCAAVKANDLGVRVDVSVHSRLLLNHCGKKVPSGFTCPPCLAIRPIIIG